jgi:N6-adenosine-specific RNA methylase IME4
MESAEHASTAVEPWILNQLVFGGCSVQNRDRIQCRVLSADPPWRFGDKLPGKARGAEKHYECMSVSEIMRMPLPPLHDDCVLFLWRVSSMVEEAYQVVRAWDFVPKTELVWEKTTDESGDKLAIGMGRILRGAHETCIVAARGDRIETMSKSERTVFRAPRGAHSEKPEEFYRIVERLYPLELWPEAHVELFARKRRKGWIQFGNGLPGTWAHTAIAIARDTEEAKEEPKPARKASSRRGSKGTVAESSP